MTKESLIELCRPVAQRLRALSLTEPAHVEAALHDLDTTALEAALREAHAEGWLAPRDAGAFVRFGRLCKPEALDGFSVDVVEMSGPALGFHTHLSGEVSLCLPLSGAPRFDGRQDRWVCYPPGSRHLPTCVGGTILIAYFMPGGAVRFEP